MSTQQKQSCSKGFVAEGSLGCAWLLSLGNLGLFSARTRASFYISCLLHQSVFRLLICPHSVSGFRKFLTLSFIFFCFYGEFSCNFNQTVEFYNLKGNRALTQDVGMDLGACIQGQLEHRLLVIKSHWKGLTALYWLSLMDKLLVLLPQNNVQKHMSSDMKPLALWVKQRLWWKYHSVQSIPH